MRKIITRYFRHKHLLSLLSNRHTPYLKHIRLLNNLSDLYHILSLSITPLTYCRLMVTFLKKASGLSRSLFFLLLPYTLITQRRHEIGILAAVMILVMTFCISYDIPSIYASYFLCNILVSFILFAIIVDITFRLHI